MYLLVLIVAAAICREMIVTEEYTDYLKKHVSWEVVDYEDNVFRGWSIEEAQSLLMQEVPEYDEPLPLVEVDTEESTSEIVWAGNCTHEVRNQGQCAGGWAFATADMLSSRCCLHKGKDHGWLSAQELLDCDKQNSGCKGGFPFTATKYIVNNKGLVHEACLQHKGKSETCRKTCEDGEDWKESHVCSCARPLQCIGFEPMKICLKKGPFVATMYVTQSFYSYKSGIFKCFSVPLGLHSVLIEGQKDKPECHWIAKNSWGKHWGEQGRFYIGCTACNIHGQLRNGNTACEEVG